VLVGDDDVEVAVAVEVGQQHAAAVVFVAQADRVGDVVEIARGLAAEVATAAGAAVIGTDTIDPEGTDYSAAVTAVSDSGADTVFFGGYYADAVKLSQQLRDAGVEATLVFGDGVKDQAGYADAAGPAGEGAVIACPCKDGEGAFLEAWQAKYHEVPGTYGAEYYDVANVFLSIIKDGATTREAVLAGVEAYDAPGITKNIKFLETGEATEAGTIFFYEVKEGKITYLTSLL
jgi:branched-chain amino acid transport system substrate-binding protein